MREILFRGKRLDGDGWFFGYYKTYTSPESGRLLHFIGDPDLGGVWWASVDPETVGQYTGLQDKNGKKIFEGDIVKGRDALAKFEVHGYVAHRDGSFVIVGDLMVHYRWLDYEVEVIGTIHDNPELLEE